jgi:tol-pal system protein YbgF
MSEDNEFRFQQLEGSAGTVPAPSNDTGALAPTQQAPAADPTTTATLPELEPLDLGTDNGEPMHGELGESSDPLVGTGSMGSGVLGGNEAVLGGQPLDLSLDSGAELSHGDADAQYQAGFEAIQRGDYAFAEDQFQQFIQLYPNDPYAPDATSLLGDALMQRGDYQTAALVLAEGYEKYQQTQRAPDLMLKLGIALVGTGEVDLACRTFFTLEKRYPDLAPALRQRISDEKARAQCPV